MLKVQIWGGGVAQMYARGDLIMLHQTQHGAYELLLWKCKNGMFTEKHNLLLTLF